MEWRANNSSVSMRYINARQCRARTQGKNAREQQGRREETTQRKENFQAVDIKNESATDIASHRRTRYDKGENDEQVLQTAHRLACTVNIAYVKWRCQIILATF